MLGANDDPDSLALPPGKLREVQRRNPGLRLGATGLVMDSLVASVLEQKVTVTEAHRAWRHLLRRHGTPAPGPGTELSLMVAPSAREWALVPSLSAYTRICSGRYKQRCSAPLAKTRALGAIRRRYGRGSGTLRRVITMQPVLEIYTPDGFDLWPVAEIEPFDFLPLSGELSPAEVGTAVMRIAGCNDIDPDGDRPPRPADALGSFLHGLLTFDSLFAAGGLRVTDNSTGVTFVPGCCDGLEDWREWHRFVDEGSLLGFGHEPVSPLAERFGDTVRLTVNNEQTDSPVIELSATELCHLLAGAERDLTDFLALAADWASRHLPGHCGPVTAALARVLDLPVPTEPLEP
ncbi:hypothetical protein [Kitasatospora paracochleata]